MENTGETKETSKWAGEVRQWEVSLSLLVISLSFATRIRKLSDTQLTFSTIFYLFWISLAYRLSATSHASKPALFFPLSIPLFHRLDSYYFVTWNFINLLMLATGKGVALLKNKIVLQFWKLDNVAYLRHTYMLLTLSVHISVDWHDVHIAIVCDPSDLNGCSNDAIRYLDLKTLQGNRKTFF